MLSLFGHIILAIVLLSSRPIRLPEPSVFAVSIEPGPSLAPKEQIVSPPAQAAKEPPRETSKISDIDSQAVIEQVKRGDSGGSQVAKPQQPLVAPQQPRKQPPQKSESPPQKQLEQGTKDHTRQEVARALAKEQPSKPAKPQSPAPAEVSESKDLLLRNLKLDDSTLTQKFAENRSEPQRPSASARSVSGDLNQYRAFSRPQGSGAAFIGSGGVNDHLPSLPDGDITLLNAKANTYAGFVRRVAVQVFGQLKSKGWERLSSQELRALSDFTTIEAVLSPEGNLLRTTIISSSGSTSFDGVVNQSVAAGARDPNPPPGARANDGQIHFIFKARSWSQVGVNARNGLPSERRWLLLATGLE